MPKLKIIPLGGLGEIGMNCLALECQDTLVFIDCGIQFPDSNFPGVDLLAPDLTYFRANKHKLKGVVVTHGHDDHIGAIPFLAKERDVDVYCTPFPRGLLENKLQEHYGLHTIRYRNISVEEPKPFDIGPFRFHPIRVQHSIIESLAFAIETPVGIFVHTGDFKHDPAEFKGQVIGFGEFKKWGDKGVTCLLSDSTNAERLGHTLSEFDISTSFEGILSKQKGRIFIALFASNIRRVENLIRLCGLAGKKVALAGRSMLSYTKLAFDLKSLDFPIDTLIPIENTGKYPDDQVVILITGSQAEPQSALIRAANGTHKDISLREGDLVILSSRFIPGNERNITGMIDQLYRLGADVLYESIHQIHVSGHGFQEELVMMLDAVRPEFFIPIHGEYRHLRKHATLAAQTGVRKENLIIVEDGQVVEADEKGMRLGEKLELRKVAIVEGEFLDGTPEAFSQRMGLAKTGVVFAVFIRDAHTHRLEARPQLACHGLLFREGLASAEVVRDCADMALDFYEKAAHREDLYELLRLEIRRFFKKRVSHKPLVIPMILDV